MRANLAICCGVLLCHFVFAVSFLTGAETLHGPPAVHSKEGCLRVLRDTAIPPSVARVMILPHVESVVLAEDEDAYHIMVPWKEGTSVACRVPKNARTELLARWLRGEGGAVRVFFAGALEVDAEPLPLFKGEELAVAKRLPSGWRVFLPRAGEVFEVFVPRTLPRVEFRRKSAFDLFAEKQHKKGLVLFEGKWIPKRDAKRISADRAEKEKRRSELWKAVKSAAADFTAFHNSDRRFSFSARSADILLASLFGIHFPSKRTSPFLCCFSANRSNALFRLNSTLGRVRGTKTSNTSPARGRKTLQPDGKRLATANSSPLNRGSGSASTSNAPAKNTLTAPPSPLNQRASNSVRAFFGTRHATLVPSFHGTIIWYASSSSAKTTDSTWGNIITRATLGGIAVSRKTRKHPSFEWTAGGP